ncbi:type I polyketide synthase [Stigmatella erecta]|uniref:Acyl transferase domain-containing protein n=1 Tax=Stigmatella erecta TaxID=83460 RepID=A0A1I0K527_9BACT|nr:type I polyketide synthase [Stigmatella erecta]SEU18851.1 Acyl transferase domain-containing protein [Stigmatella erecta]
MNEALQAISDILAELTPEDRAALAAMVGKAPSPVAIVGIGCRFPGGADNPERFWEFLRAGTDAVREVPRERWNVDDYYDPDPQAPGKMVTRYGTFLDEVDRFDAPFFEISGREAQSMDPQQRLLLQVGWEALESAGLPPDGLKGRAVGVFVGSCLHDYEILAQRRGLERFDAHSVTGGMSSVLAGRLSHFLGLHGPSLTVDTACSSSLVALHLACQSLRAGESDVALAAGVNLLLAPESMVMLSRLGALSPDGRCKSFDIRANGFARGEGCGVVVLKRLPDALAAEDRIFAVIRGSAVNHDGRSTGLAAPNAQAQKAVITEALGNAGVRPEQVGYIEAHGTGTPLGDPIEVDALKELFASRKDGSTCGLGSVKTNLGHLEAAAGIAGIIKVALSLQQEAIPPHLHLTELNPRIQLSGSPFSIPASVQPWKRAGAPRIAGVSSFGLSGTNAHVVMEEAPVREQRPVSAGRPAHLLTLSAKSSASLRELARRYAALLGAPGGAALGDVARSTHLGRSLLSHRLAVVAEGREEAQEALSAFAEGKPSRTVACGEASASQRPRVAFLFTGELAPLTAAGRTLHETEPVYRAAVERCAQLLGPALGAGVTQALLGRGALEDASIVQPALFIMQYALAELWASFGVRPEGVLGYGAGELSAACVAGVLSLEDALRLAAERGRLLQGLPEAGEAAAVFASEAEAARAIALHPRGVTMAAFDEPGQVVIAGAAAALREVVAALEAQGLRTSPVRAPPAFRRPGVEAMLPAWERAVAQVRFSPPRCVFASTVTGAMAAPGGVAHADYWRRQAGEPVRFRQALEALRGAGFDTFVELGRQPALIGLGRKCLPTAEAVTWVASLKPEREEARGILEGLGELVARGVQVELSGLHRDERGPRIPLPTYPFAKERYWLEAAAAAQGPYRPSAPGTGLLGTRREFAGDTVCFEASWKGSELPFAKEHRFDGGPALPSAAQLVRVHLAAAQVMGSERVELQRVRLQAPLAVTDPPGDFQSQLLLTPAKDGYAFDIASARMSGGDMPPVWTRHASGTLSFPRGAPGPAPAIATDGIEGARLGTEQVSAQLRTWGHEPGRRLESVWSNGREAVAQLRAGGDGTGWDPLLLETSLLAAAFVSAPAEDQAFFPGEIARLVFGKAVVPGELLTCTVRRTADATADVWLTDGQGQTRLEARGVRLEWMAREQLPSSLRKRAGESVYEVSWSPASPPQQAETTACAWLLFADEGGVADALAAHIRSTPSASVVRVRPGDAFSEGPGGFRVRPGEAADYARLLEALRGAGGPLLTRVVHLWALDGREKGGAPGDEASRLSWPVVALVQALAKANANARVHVVTRGAQAVHAGELPTPAQAALWGLGRVVADELASLWGGVLDLEAPGTPADAERMYHALLGGSWPQGAALRGGGWHTPRLTRAVAEYGEPVTFRRDASYLLTGGAGALGRAVATWMADQGARCLVLAGRSDGSREVLALEQELAARGVRVVLERVDVARREEVQALLSRMAEQLPPLRGVVHAAGVLEDALLVNQDPAAFARVLAPKVAGTVHLDELTRQRPLDFFVSFSSIAALLGNAGQGAYAAANAFLDAFAATQRARGLPALTVSWGTWQVGMAAAASATRKHWLQAMPPGLGVNVLGRLMRSGRAWAIGMSADWSCYEDGNAVRALLLEELTRGGSAKPAPAPVPQAQSPVAPVSTEPPLVSALRQVAAARHEEFVLDQVSRIVRTVLLLDDAIPVSPTRRLDELGLDSLLAVDLVNALRAETGLPLPVTLPMEHPNTAAIARYIHRSLEASAAP